MLITVSGKAGTGKSTLAKQLAAKLNLKYVCAGNIIREMAAEHEMDVIEFGEYLKKHPKLDLEVDQRMLKEGKKGAAVLEGRLVAWMMKKNHIPAYKILLAASPEVAASRIVEREGGEVEEETKKAAVREKTNWQRYQELYGISAEDEAWYDLIVDTDQKDRAEVLEWVFTKINKLA